MSKRYFGSIDSKAGTITLTREETRRWHDRFECWHFQTMMLTQARTLRDRIRRTVDVIGDDGKILRQYLYP